MDSVEPVEIYGVNDVKLNVIKKHFPKLKLVARGYSLKVIGDTKEINKFEKKLNLPIHAPEFVLGPTFELAPELRIHP